MCIRDRAETAKNNGLAPSKKTTAIISINSFSDNKTLGLLSSNKSKINPINAAVSVSAIADNILATAAKPITKWLPLKHQ